MVNTKAKNKETYLLVGEDKAAKDAKTLELKRKFANSETLNFDYDCLFGNKLDSDDLKKTLMSLPALAKKRFVILYECNKLSPNSKKVIKQFLEEGHNHVVLVMIHDGKKDAFVRSISSLVQVIDYTQEEQGNVFDMTRMISQRRDKDALKILSELLNAGQHPLQIMGALVWFWGKTKSRISKSRFNEGLGALQEADLNIKRSRLKPEHAIELVVVKLAHLA